MDSLGKIFYRKAADTPILRVARSSVLIDEANKVIARTLGAAGARLVCAVHYKDGVLSVASLSPSAASDLKNRENEFLRRLADATGVRLKEIRYLV